MLCSENVPSLSSCCNFWERKIPAACLICRDKKQASNAPAGHPQHKKQQVNKYVDLQNYIQHLHTGIIFLEEVEKNYKTFQNIVCVRACVSVCVHVCH